MGKLTTAEALLHRWDEVLQDPTLRELPYKIEVNARGKVEMSPASVRHGWLQAAVAAAFAQHLPEGVTVTECPILTSIGVRVPEICVEVVSSSNVESEINAKVRAYLAAGAEEVWLVAENGTIRFVDQSGEKAQSRFTAAVTLPDPTKGYL